MNTPQTPQPFDDSAARVRRHLEASTDSMTMTPTPVTAIKDRAEKRTARRQRAVAVGLVAAASIGVVGGIATLTRTEPDRVSTSSATEGGAPVDSTGQSPSTAVPGTDPGSVPVVPTTIALATTPGGYSEFDDLIGDLSTAQKADPSFVWKVVDPGKEASISGTFGNGFDTTFPAFAISTAPGRSNDYDNIESFLYRSDDGISWSRTQAQAPFSNRFWNATVNADHVFVTGTAPGIAATQPNPLQIAVSAGQDWAKAELPIDTNAKTDLPMIIANAPQVSSVPYSTSAGDGVLVVVTESAFPDYEALSLAAGIGDNDLQIVDQQADGVAMVSNACLNANQSYDPVAELLGPEGGLDTIPSTIAGPVADGDDFYGCPATVKTWVELGLPPESIDAITTAQSRFFVVSPDLDVTEIDGPGEGGYYPIGNGKPVVELAMNYYTGEVAPRYELVDGTWVEAGSGVQSAWLEQGAMLRDLGDRQVGFFGSRGDGRVPFMSIATDGTVSGADLQTAFPANSSSWSELSAVTGSHWVGAVQTDTYPAPGEGGLELPFGDVIVRVDDRTGRFEMVDAASGEPIDRSMVTGKNDGTIEVLDDNGEVRATFKIEDLYNAVGPGSEERRTSTSSIVTTADGVSFSVESVASLLGLDDADVSRVARVASDGTAVIVTVTLNERYLDDIPKQLVLVGTPID